MESRNQLQALQHESSEHLLESPDPLRSIQDLHVRQRQNRVQPELLNQNKSQSCSGSIPKNSPQEQNLITFTPTRRQNENACSIHHNQNEPKKQRSPRKKTRNEWRLNQGQFELNKTQEISHIVPDE